MWSSISPDDWDWLKSCLGDGGTTSRELAIERCRTEKPHLMEFVIRMLAIGDSDSTMSLTVAPSAPMFRPGDLISGRYEIEAAIGIGGMGEVYRASDRHWPKRGSLALKTIRTALAQESQLLARFEHEVRHALQVAHPNVCRIYDVDRHDAGGRIVPYLTMEYLPGQTLGEHLRANGPMAEMEALCVLRQLAAGLAAIHARNIVHRDFKPGNVILTPDSSGFRAVITDFGLARALEDAANTLITRAGGAVGTLPYMAPEQISGDSPVNCSADVYAYGVTAHEMLTGKRYQPGGSLDGLDDAGVSKKLKAVIARCLERDRNLRFQTGGDIGAALDQPAAKVAPRPRQRRIGDVLVGIAISVLLAAAVWFAANRFAAPRVPGALHTTMTQASVKYFNNSFYDASKLLERVVAAAPDYPLARAMLSDSYNELELTGKAQQQIIAMRNESRASADDRLYIEGVRATLTHDYDGAARTFRSWYEGADESARPQRAIVLGRALERAHKPDEAEKAYKAAGKSGAALLSLAVLHSREERIESAEREFEEARAEFRDAAEYGAVAAVDSFEGAAFTRWNRSADARSMLQRCIDDARTTGNSYDAARCKFQLATLALREARSDQDLRDPLAEISGITNEAASQGFGMLAARAWLALGQVYQIRRRNEDAERAFSAAMSQARNEGSQQLVAYIEIARGDLLQRLGRQSEAEAGAREALAYFELDHSAKEAAQAAVIFARILRNEGRNREALDILRSDKILAAAPPLERRQLDETEASILFAEGNYPAALAKYKNVLAALPTNVDRTPVQLSVAESEAASGYLAEASSTLDSLARKPLTPESAAAIPAHRAWIDIYSLHPERALAELAGGVAVSDNLARGLALIEAGRFNEGRAACEAVEAIRPAEKAQAKLCIARALFGMRQFEAADERLAGIDYSALNNPELDWRIAAAEIEIKRVLGQPTEPFEQRMKASLSRLRRDWGDAAFHMYVTRPDIAATLRQAHINAE